MPGKKHGDQYFSRLTDGKTWRDTFVTATWKVYSVTRLVVRFEKEARMWITESLFAGRLARKTMFTGPLCTVKSFEVGRLVFSSGKAELKFHSSSADAPLVC